ncbi:MAG: hypothetical protein IJT58_01380 [Synergistaceae bacterium]|nr:hypothetical protein [Synergistaceae bacterium]
MFLTEWDMEKVLAVDRLESEERGIKIGERRGEKRTRESVARTMLKKNLPLDLIQEVTQLSAEAVIRLAKKFNLKVVEESAD